MNVSYETMPKKLDLIEFVEFSFLNHELWISGSEIEFTGKAFSGMINPFSTLSLKEFSLNIFSLTV